MKKWLMGLGILLIIVLCAYYSVIYSQINKEQKQSSTESEEQSEEEIVEMTQQQEEVFRSYGLSDERIEEIKKKGLNYKEQSFVDAALMMLNYLEEKYGEKFQVVGGDIPGILSHEYWIKAEALEGDHAGETFDVYYKGENGYRDGYITFLKQDEAGELMKKLILSKFSNVLVFPYLSGEYGNELSLDDRGEELLKKVDCSYNIIVTDADMSEEEFHQLANDIEKYLDDNEIPSSGGVRYFNGSLDQNMTDDDLNDLIDKDAFQWNDYIRSDW